MKNITTDEYYRGQIKTTEQAIAATKNAIIDACNTEQFSRLEANVKYLKQLTTQLTKDKADYGVEVCEAATS